MELSVLGPFRATPGPGEQPATASPATRALLSALLLFHGRPCTPALLARAVWGTRPPASPEAALRTLASRARTVIEAASGQLDKVPAGYTARPAPGTLDAARFTQAITEAAAAAVAGAKPKAAAALETALACWPPGPPAAAADADHTAAPQIAGEAARLAAQRQQAELDLAGLRLDLGQHTAILPRLHETAVRAPHSEPAWAQLITALARDQRPAEALAAYTRARETLIRDLGASPGPLLEAALAEALASY